MNIIITGASSGIGFETALEFSLQKENKIVEIKIHVPGDDFMVKKQCKTFEEAVDSSTEALERLLLKRKEKIRTHI